MLAFQIDYLSRVVFSSPKTIRPVLSEDQTAVGILLQDLGSWRSVWGAFSWRFRRDQVLVEKHGKICLSGIAWILGKGILLFKILCSNPFFSRKMCVPRYFFKNNNNTFKMMRVRKVIDIKTKFRGRSAERNILPTATKKRRLEEWKNPVQGRGYDPAPYLCFLRGFSLSTTLHHIYVFFAVSAWAALLFWSPSPLPARSKMQICTWEQMSYKWTEMRWVRLQCLDWLRMFASPAPRLQKLHQAAAKAVAAAVLPSKEFWQQDRLCLWKCIEP